MIPGHTSTGSKRPEALFGEHAGPRYMRRASGCRVWDDAGREYIDMMMALGAVALGYGHRDVTAAATQAARDGVVGPLAPVHEQGLAERLTAVISHGDAVRFLKTGAEAVAAAVRIARVVTGRSHVVTCGYHGWLDWCQDAAGVPHEVRDDHSTLPFNDVRALADAEAREPAALVLEPVIDAPPSIEWVQAVRAAADRTGALLILDEIKTTVRLGLEGATGRYGFAPDLVVLGKALGNGYPIAAVVGAHDLMAAVERTWISSTLATEFVALAAARAVLDVVERDRTHETIAAASVRFYRGLEHLTGAFDSLVEGVRGIPEMCYLAFRSEDVGKRVASRAARDGVLFKWNAYNFPSAAHDEATIDEALRVVEKAMWEVAAAC